MSDETIKRLQERLRATHEALNDLLGFVKAFDRDGDYHCYEKALEALHANRSAGLILNLPISGNLVDL